MAGTARLWRVLPRGLLVAGIALRVLAIFRFPVSADASEFAVAAAVLLVMNGAAFLSPRLGVFEAYGDLRERANPGDVVALDRVNKYEAELHLAGTGVGLEPYSPATRAEYILTSNTTKDYDGYLRLGVYGEGNGTAVMPEFGAALWTRTADASP